MDLSHISAQVRCTSREHSADEDLLAILSSHNVEAQSGVQLPKSYQSRLAGQLLRIRQMGLRATQRSPSGDVEGLK